MRSVNSSSFFTVRSNTKLMLIADWLQSLFPLTMRGLLVLLILSYLFLNPIWNRSDIVASVLTAILFGTIIIMLAICALAGAVIKRRINSQLIPPSHSEGSSDDGIFALLKNDFLLRVGPISVPPFFILSIELCFEQEGVTSSCRIVSQRLNPETPLHFYLTFPHRGLWRYAGIRCTLEDRFGLSCQIWSDTSQSDLIIFVRPQKLERTALPIISSTLRAGDDLSHHTQRLGEPFDIKPYQPSDGIKKILWKVFAKRGELVSRHPEHAVTPEGHVIAFVLARRNDDALAAWSLAYFRALDELNLTMEIGCLGMHDNTFAHGPEEAETLLVSNAFEAPTKISRSLSDVIAHRITSRNPSAHNQTLDSVALFISESNFTSESEVSEIIALLQNLERINLTPIVCYQQMLEESDQVPTRSLLERLLFENKIKATPQDATITVRNLFLKACAAQQISVYHEEIVISGGAFS